MVKTNHLYPAQASILLNGATFVCNQMQKKPHFVNSEFTKWAKKNVNL